MHSAEGSKKETKNGGFLHILRENLAAARGDFIRTAVIDVPTADFSTLAAASEARLGPLPRKQLAETLGVTKESLTTFRVGFTTLYGSNWFTFPMVNGDGRVVGIRLRKWSGAKLAVKGGREGLFIPTDVNRTGQLLITEGPTDAAALRDLGFNVIGRPSCTGGVQHAADFAQGSRFKEVVIAADGDDVGYRGAVALAGVLRLKVETVKVMQPPPGVKDVRAWKNAGATATDVRALIDQAESHGFVSRSKCG